jgi:RNA polymerase sigma-70 factor (ECF subfamily)
MAVLMSDDVGTPSLGEPEARTARTDAEILRGIENGERWAADALYDTLYPAVARAIQRVLPDARTDYDDLVQTTFERVMVKLLDARGRAEVASLSAWASGVAAHVALDALRTRSRERRLIRTENPSAPPLLEVARAPSTLHQIEARDQLAIIRGVLADMKSELAETVLMCDLLGHDLRDTAAATGVSVAAAQSRLVRGRKELLRRVELRLGKEPRT